MPAVQVWNEAGCIVPDRRSGNVIYEEWALFYSHPYARRRKGPRQSGILILRNGVVIGGGPYFWSVGSYTVGNGTWKGHLSTNQHTPFSDRFVRPLFAGQEVTSGFSGTFADERAEVFGTTLVGTRSLSFRATMKKLADH